MSIEKGRLSGSSAGHCLEHDNQHLTINDGLRPNRCPLGEAAMIFTYSTINLRDGKAFEAQLGQEFGLSRIRLSTARRQQAREGLG
jgi:hypothetical protein